MTRMTNACRLLAEHIQRVELDETLYGEMKFLRGEFFKMLLEKGNQEELANDYADSLEDQQVINPWLLEVTQNFFK